MKKVMLTIILLLVMVTSIQAQETKLFLPLILKNCDLIETTNMGNWKIVVPESTINYALNPSAETTGNYTAEASTTVTRSTTYQKYGLYSYRVESNANNEGIEITLSALSNATHYVTMHVRGTLPAAWDWSLNDSTFTAPTLIEAIDENWNLYGLQFSAAQSNGSTKLSIHQNGAGSGDFYLDGIQVEAKEYWTTYCDGSQKGCSWGSIANASISTRSAQSKAGGRVRDFDDYSFYIGDVLETGNVTQSIIVDRYATLPGGELNNINIEPRIFTLSGILIADSESDLNLKRKALIDLFSPTAFAKDENGYQATKLRYTGSGIQKEISVFLEQGLEGIIEAGYTKENIALRFVAPDPFFYGIGNSAQVINTLQSQTVRLVIARLKETGEWDNLGPPAAPGTAVYGSIRAIVEDDTYVYMGGSFFNFDNIAAADMIVRYNKQTGAYSALGAGGTDSTVTSLAIGPTGILYAGGGFTSMGGVANTAHLAQWNGSAWSALSTGITTGVGVAVNALLIGHDGLLYIAGGFTEAGGVSVDYIATWNGTTFAPLGTGANNVVNQLALAQDGTIYAAGLFTEAGGNPAEHIAKWNGSAWSALGTGVTGVGGVSALAVGQDNTVYLGGAFTEVGGVDNTAYLAKWNGYTWSSLGVLSGAVTGEVETLHIAPDGILYASGGFNMIDDNPLTDRLAKWNGSSWSHLDINLPTGAICYGIYTGKNLDPITQLYDLYLGFDADDTATIAQTTTLINNGSEQSFPKLIFTRSGGTSATIQMLRNETIDKELLFDYDLLDGETLTVNLSPIEKNITSSYFGNRLNAVLPNSDFGTFTLLPGTQTLSSFISNTGATVTAHIEYQTVYRSFD